MNPTKPPRICTSACFLAGSIAALLTASQAFAQNTINNYTGATAGSLLLTTNWSLGALPLVTNDAVFPFGAATGIRTLSAGDLTVGSFNVLTNSGTFTIRNDTNTATDSNLTLGGMDNLGNSVSGAAADLLYAASGSTFNITGTNGGGGTGVLNVILGQSGNFNIAAGASSTITAAISDGGSGYALTKTGVGTLTFNGAAAHTFTGGLNVRGGTLSLDFANMVTPTPTTPTDLIHSSNALTFGGGALMTIKAKTGGIATSQTFSGVTANAGGGSLLVDTLTAGNTTNLTLGSFGTFSSWVKGSSLVVGEASTNPAGALAITTTTDYDAQSIYGGRIVIASGVAGTGYDWATRDSTAASSPYTLAAFGSGGNFGTYTEMVDAATTDTLNTRMTANRSLSGDHTHNSLKIESGRTLALNGNLLTLTSGGLLATGTADSTISGTAGATRLTAGADSGYDLIVHQFSTGGNGLTISAVIGNNGTNAVSLTKAGIGNLVLSGDNTFTGGVNINAGTLTINSAQSFTGGVTLHGGKLMLGHDNALGANTLSINGGLIGTSANRIIANPVSINGDFTYTKQLDSANLLFTGAVDLGSAPGAARTITSTGANGDQHYSFTIRGVISNGPAGGGNALIKAGNGHLFLTGHNTYTGGTTVTGGDEWSALYIGHNNALGTGTLNLNGGAIMAYGESPRTITNNVLWGGNFNFGGTNVTFQDLAIAGTTNTGTIARTVTIASNAKTTLGAVTYAGDHTFNFSNSAAVKSLEMTGDVTLTGGNRIFTVTNGGAATPAITALVISGAVKEDVAGRGLTKAGTGVLLLSGNNIYTGTTTVTAGVLRTTGATSLPSGSLLQLNGGVLESSGSFIRPVGSTAGSAQVYWSAAGGFAAQGGALNVNLGNSAATLDWAAAAGSGGLAGQNLIFGSTTANNVVTVANGLDMMNAARTITVEDNTTTDADYAVVSGVVSNSTGNNTQALTKVGVGTLVLAPTAGPNTYSGNTLISAGALLAADGTGLPTGSLLQLAGGVLESSGSFTRPIGNTAGGTQVYWSAAGGFSAQGGALNVNLGGSAATLNWADTAAAGGLAGQNLIFGSTTANNVVTLANGLNLNDATRTVQVNDNAYSGVDYATISGVIASTNPSSGALTKTGTGTLVLAPTTGPNTYTGATTITGGALRAVQGTGLPNDSYLRLDGGVLEGSGVTSFTRVNSASAGSGNFNWATTNGGGFSANGGKMTVNIGGALTQQVWGAAAGNDTIWGTLKFGSATANAETEFQNPINLNNAGRTIQVEDNPHSADDFATISGIISSVPAGGGITKTGTGLLVLANTGNSYTGATIVNGGVLRVPNATNILGGLTLTGGGVFETTGTITRTLTSTNGVGNLNLAGSGGFSAFGGTLEINLRGQATPVEVPWNDNFGGGGQRTADGVNGNDARRMYSNAAVMTFNSIYSDNMVEWRNPLALGWNSSLTPDTVGVRYSAGKIREIQVNDNPNLTTDFARMSGAISDGPAPATNNGIRKLGTGQLELTAANTYTGKTFVDAGRLHVNGSLGNSEVVVNAAGNLGGTGTMNGSVTVNGSLTPGGTGAIETLGSGALTFNNGSAFNYQFDSSAALGVAAALQKVTGNLTLNTSPNAVILNLSDLAASPVAFAANTKFSLLNYTGTWSGGFFTLGGNELTDGEQFTAGLNTWKIDYDEATGGSNFDGEHVAGNFVNLTAVSTGPTPYDDWMATFTSITDPADKLPAADPDNDAYVNFLEFAIDGDPSNGANRGRQHVFTSDTGGVGTDLELVLTVAVRKGTPTFTGTISTPWTATKDGIKYEIGASFDNLDFPIGSNVGNTSPVTSGLDPLPMDSQYEYRSFVHTGSEGLPDKAFLRLRAKSSP